MSCRSAGASVCRRVVMSTPQPPATARTAGEVVSLPRRRRAPGGRFCRRGLGAPHRAGGAGVDAVGKRDLLQCQVSLRLVVEGVEDDAVGEYLGRLVIRGEGPDGFGGEGGFAHAAGAAEGGDIARLEVGQERGEFGRVADEVGGAERLLQRHGGSGSLWLRPRRAGSCGRGWGDRGLPAPGAARLRP